MNSDLGKNNYYSFEQKIQEVMAEIVCFQRNPRLMRTPEETEAVEGEIGGLVDRLHGLLFGLQLQYSLASEELHEDEKKLVKSWQEQKRPQNEEGPAVLSYLMA